MRARTRSPSVRGASIAVIFVIVLLVMSTFPLFVGTKKMIDVGREYLLNEIREQQIPEADLLASELTQYYASAMSGLKELSTGLYFLTITERTTEERQREISMAIRATLRHVPWEALELRTYTGEEYWYNRKRVTTLDLQNAWQKLFVATLMEGQAFQIVHPSENATYFLMGYRYGDEHRAVVTLGLISGEYFAQPFQRQQKRGRYIFLVEAAPPYRITLTSDPRWASVGARLTGHPLVGSVSPQNQNYVLQRGDRTVRVLGTARPIPELRSLLILENDVRTIQMIINQMARTGLMWAAGVTVLTVLLALIAAASLAQPVRQLAQLTDEIARTRRFHQRLKVRGVHEIRMLKAAFNRLLDEIQDYIRQVEQKAEENRQLFYDSIRMLTAAIDAKDPYTRGHSERVSQYARIIAQHMDLSEQEIEQVYLAGLLHDVGKIGIQDRILQKPAALTGDEYDIMKTHPERGYQIMKQIPQLEPVLPGIRYHHENWDGTGYPAGIRGEEIPLVARIVAVADTFDAMTTDRPYQRGMPPDKAVERILLLSGKRFDPKVVQAFIRAYTEGKLRPIAKTPPPEWVRAIQTPEPHQVQ